MRIFRRHSAHTYEGYHFPWFLTLFWITFFSAAVIYLVRFLLLSGAKP